MPLYLMHKLLTQPSLGLVLNHKFFRFLLIGGLNTLFGYACYAALIKSGLSVAYALLLSQLLGIIFNYQSYGRLLFVRKSDENQCLRFERFIRFVGAYSFTYVLNLLILKLLTAASLSPYLAQVFALIAIVPISYILLQAKVWR